MPLGSTTLACTVPLAKKDVPEGLIFMSRMVTLRRMCGLGCGPGKIVSTLIPGKASEEMMMLFDSPER